MIQNFKYFIPFLFVLMHVTNVLAQSDAQILDFAKAAKFNDVREVKSLLSQGINPNTVDSNGNPMLVLAVRDRSFALKRTSITA